MTPTLFHISGLLLSLLTLLLIIVLSGAFLWVGLKVIGKEQNLLFVGVVNLASAFFAMLITSILAVIPLLSLLSPVLGYFAYIYALKGFLKLTFWEAFLASFLAALVFVVIVLMLFFVFGFWVFKFTPIHKPTPIPF